MKLSFAAILVAGASIAVRAQDDTGCNLTPGSALRVCLGDYVSVPPAAPTALSNLDQAAYYCNMYQQLANCWAVGTYCREWYPLQVAADEFCFLANGTAATNVSETALPAMASAIASSEVIMGGLAGMAAAATATKTATLASATIASVEVEASNVVTSIWNNDVGTAVPSITDNLQNTTTIVTWTHITTATPLPVSDPLTTLNGTTFIPAPTHIRRVKIARELA